MAKKKPEGYTFGRPTLYKPEYCDQLIEHMSKGYSFESFAGALRVSKQIIYDWRVKHSDFLDAFEIANELCRMFWEGLGINHITHIDSKFESTPKLNSTVYMFNMKNRFYKEWRDRTEVKNEVKINSKELEDMSDEDLLDLSKRALEAFKGK